MVNKLTANPLRDEVDPVDSPDQAGAMGPTARWRRTRAGIMTTAIVIVLVSMTLTVVACMGECPVDLARVVGYPMALAWFICLGYGIANAVGWVFLLHALGFRPSCADGMKVWLGCEAFRWLPGSVWNLGARSAEAAKRGVPIVVTAATIALELALSVISRTILVAVAGLAYASSIPSRPVPVSWKLVLVAIAGVVAIGWAGGYALRRGLGQQIRDLRHVLEAIRMRWWQLPVLLGYHLAIRTLHGIGLWCVVQAIAAESHVPVGAAVAANALAWLAGFFAVFAPGGLVVREAVLAAVLATWLSPPQALAVAMGWRILQIISEATLVSGVWLRSQRSAPAQWAVSP